MIHQIAVPIYRSLSQEAAFLEASKYGNTDNPGHPSNAMKALYQETIAELDKCLNDGYTVIDMYDSSHGTVTYRTYILRKADNAPGATGATGSMKLALAITRKQTYSKSTQQNFDFWKLDLNDGKMVNVFNHPDTSRNTYQLVTDAAWGDLWELFQVGETYVLDNPLPVMVANDGDWLKLTGIINFVDFSDVSQFTYVQNASDNEE